MNKIILTISFLILGAGAFAGNLRSKVDIRMELLSIVAKLAEYPEYRKGEIEVYNKRIDEYFSNFKSHPVVETAKRMRESSRPPHQQLQYDGVLLLAMHLIIDKDTIYINPKLVTEGVDNRCFNELTPQFLKELNDFYIETKAQEFFNLNKEFYHTFESYLQQNVLNQINDKWFESFMGYKPDNFHLIQTLLTGILNYGATTIDNQGSESAYASICCFLSKNGEPEINTTYAISTIIHEFAHYYCNPLIDKNIELLQPYISIIYSQMGENIKDEPYEPKEAVLTEPFVRAIEILYAKKNNNNFSMILADQKNLGIYWIEDFIILLEKYQNNSNEYRNIDDFMPEVIKFYAELASNVEKL